MEALDKLVARFATLPGVGVKTAQRLAYSLLTRPVEEVKDFARDMYDARVKIKPCPVCGNLAENGLCEVCKNPTRDTSVVCVVKDTRDVMAIEKSGAYRGVYHVLGGTLSPLDGVGPDQINIAGLVKRLLDGDIKEVILATGADVSGEATAAFIGALPELSGVAVTRIAHGIPIGAELEYADGVTIARALQGRKEL